MKHSFQSIFQKNSALGFQDRIDLTCATLNRASVYLSFITYIRNRRAFLFSNICIFFLLVACSPNFAVPPQEELSPPGLSEHIFTSYDGVELPMKVWLPVDTTAAVIIAVHGFNDYSNSFTKAAAFFNNNSLAVYAYDQRGFGATRGRWSGT